MSSNQSSINLAYLLIGSNIEPEKNLSEAVKLLARFGRITANSSVWQSAAVGFTEQPDFLNAAVLLETDLSPEKLRQDAIRSIENALGRVRTEDKNGPRTVDIDIILFNHDVLSIGNRLIPDPELLEYPFIAIPMAEIAPAYVHPEVHKTLREIAHQFKSKTDTLVRRDDVKL